jgi:hypothetical protein
VALITARIVLFNQGDSLGAWAVLIAFWLTSAVLAIHALVVLARGEGRWEHRLIVLALAAFFVTPILGMGPASKVCFVVFVIATFSLIVIYTKRLFGEHRHA